MRHPTAMTLIVLWAAVAAAQPALHEAPDDPAFERAAVGPEGGGAHIVATTQRIAPAGVQIAFAGRPVDLALHPGGRLLAIKNIAGITFADLDTGEVVQDLKLVKDGTSHCGIRWSADGARVYVTTSTRELIAAARGGDGVFRWEKPILIAGPQGPADVSVPGGFAIDDAAGRAYVTISRNNSLGIVRLADGAVEAEIPTGIAPYDVLRAGSLLYVSNWGGRRPQPGDLTGPTSGSKAVIDAAGIASTGSVTIIDIEARAAVGETPVGLHPSGMALSPGGERLYVANANSDTVSVIDTATRTVAATWDLRPMAELPLGSAPNALAVSPGGDTLYVALGGNNAIAVVDTAAGAMRGLIPVGWYPGAVMLADAGRRLVVANTKGVGSRESDPAAMRKRLGDYAGQPIGGDVMYNSKYYSGSVSVVEAPDAAALARHTHDAAVNLRLPRMHEALEVGPVAPRAVPIPTRPGERSHFKHVVYIIKENRTYDQVFGDLPQGNGDPGLCHFGRDVTPNHHDLAEQFVLLDNFYCNGVLSADGHQWVAEGAASDYIEKSFGGFERSYPYDGDDALAYAASGFIWDHVLRKGYSFRNYGEMVKATIEPAAATWADCWRDFNEGTQTVRFRARTELRGLEPYIHPVYIGFPGKVQDAYRARIFLDEFRQYEAAGALPNFIVMLLPNDHTEGTRESYPTPRACVADNDLALGRIVEAITKSRFWPDTVIFVVEDDPQAGLDHVDGHRTVALCISPYTRRGHVDSAHYNQTSILRSIELIFGLAPMTQFTLGANPMLGCFQETPDLRPYAAVPNIIPLDEMNPPKEKLSGLQLHYAELSEQLPLDDIDEADEDTLNRILWHSVKGYDTPYPVLATAERSP